MTASVRRAGFTVLCLILVIGMAPTASAFFPLGGFDPFNVMKLSRWGLSDFDNNNDGDIREDEGLRLLLEDGPSGFTEEELLIVRSTLDVWADVPTSFVAFQVEGVTQDPIAAGGAPDFRNSIVMQVTADDVEQGFVADTVLDPVVGYPVLGVCYTFSSAEETVVEIDGQAVTISAGRIFESDIIIDAASVRPDLASGTNARGDLFGLMVHELGHFLGLGHTPLNNLRFSGGNQLENTAIYLTGSDGEQAHIGVTPSMFPFSFLVQKGDDVIDGWRDLAPDDISAISYLYPRTNQSNFFSIKQEARTRRRAGSGLPSAPLTGSHVVAWADTDNNPNTSYVPVFSTMAGLYEPANSPQLGGIFEILGMWKQMEQPGAQGFLYNPSYIFTVSPLNLTGYDRQSPPNIVSADIDSLQGPSSRSVRSRGAGDYAVFFPSEVFQEQENLIDVSNRDAGTPMVWSFERNTLISVDSGETLPTIRPVDLPMFGDPNDVCPLNIIEGGSGGAVASLSAGPGILRGLRDNVLLESAVGTALVSAYYHAGPWMSRYFLSNAEAFGAWRTVVLAGYWCLENYRMIALTVGAIIVMVLGWSLRRRMRRATASALLAGTLLAGTPAHAAIAFVTDAQLAEGAQEAIVYGKVVALESRKTTQGGIFTDVSFEIQQVAKGRINKNTTITISVPGGRVGALVATVSEMPVFTVGEEAVLYLNFRSNAYVIHGGTRGTVRVLTNPDGKQAVLTNSAYVTGEAGVDLKAKYLPEDAAAEEDHKAGEDGLDHTGHDHGDPTAGTSLQVPLDEYMDYLRALVQEEAKKTP